MITFTHDNCPINRATRVKDWKRENSAQKYSWAAHSRTNLNSIQNVWAYMKRRLQCKVLDLENFEEYVMYIWNKLPLNFFETCTSQCLTGPTSAGRIMDNKVKQGNSFYFSPFFKCMAQTFILELFRFLSTLCSNGATASSGLASHWRRSHLLRISFDHFLVFSS